MIGWTQTTTARLLQDGVIEIGDGYRAKNAEFRTNGGLPFVRVGDIGKRICLEGRDELPLDRAPTYGSKISQPHDSLITMKGTVGRVAYVSESDRTFVYSPQISYWRSRDASQVNPRWLRYWLESPEFLSQALATKGATDMADYINLRDQRRMRITLPSTDEQRQIASVLGYIDDLIGNHRLRVELLEQMAQAVYREWFSLFRFPGHQDIPFVDSPLGFIPTGWEAATWGDLATLDYGRALRGYRDASVGYPVFGTNGPIGWHDVPLFPSGVVVGRKGAYRGIHFTDRPCWVIDTAFYLNIRDPTRVPSLFAYYQLRTVDLDSIDSGSAIPSTSRDSFYAIPLVLPPVQLVQRFTDSVALMLTTSRTIEQSARTVEEIRNLLLPKLVTGQIDVSNLDLDALVDSVA